MSEERFKATTKVRFTVSKKTMTLKNEKNIDIQVISPGPKGEFHISHDASLHTILSKLPNARDPISSTGT